MTTPHNPTTKPQTDLVSYYWNKYFQWRRIGGFDEVALREVVRGIRDDIAAHAASGTDAVRLKKLAAMIETELRLARDACAEPQKSA